MISSSNWAKEDDPICITLEEVISSGIENLYVVLSLFPTQTRPGLSLINFGVLSFVAPRFTSSSFIFAVAAVLERGTYPILRARETTFSRTVAESKNDSFAVKFALNALI